MCLVPWEVEMPYGGQSSRPVQVALLGQVSWETATSCPAIVQGEGQWLPCIETLCQAPGASGKQGGTGRSRRGVSLPRLGTPGAEEGAFLRPFPCPSLAPNSGTQTWTQVV